MEGFKILGGSESFEAAIAAEELQEEENWMAEAEEIPVSAEEVIQRIRSYRENRAASGGGGCGGNCSCTCGKR